LVAGLCAGVLEAFAGLCAALEALLGKGFTGVAGLGGVTSLSQSRTRNWYGSVRKHSCPDPGLRTVMAG
jgi:hypothetical protein